MWVRILIARSPFIVGSSQNPYYAATATVRTVADNRENRKEEARMMTQTEEAQQQHLLLLVESAQRAGLSEAEIGEIADAAVEADAKLELDRAA
jgi:hypothetical protein